jgi:hypothetical protein
VPEVEDGLEDEVEVEFDWSWSAVAGAVVVVLEVVLVVVEVGADVDGAVIVLPDGLADELGSALVCCAWAAAARSMEEITIASAFLRMSNTLLGSGNYLTLGPGGCSAVHVSAFGDKGGR